MTGQLTIAGIRASNSVEELARKRAKHTVASSVHLPRSERAMAVLGILITVPELWLNITASDIGPLHLAT